MCLLCPLLLIFNCFMKFRPGIGVQNTFIRIGSPAQFSSASRIFSHAEPRRARREEDWIFSACSACSAAPREPLYSPSSNISFLHRCRGFSFASRIFSHAEPRRARREEDWIFSACSAAPREPLYSPSSLHVWDRLKANAPFPRNGHTCFLRIGKATENR